MKRRGAQREAIPLRGLEGVPGLPGAPQDEAGLTLEAAQGRYPLEEGQESEPNKGNVC